MGQFSEIFKFYWGKGLESNFQTSASFIERGFMEQLSELIAELEWLIDLQHCAVCGMEGHGLKSPPMLVDTWSASRLPCRPLYSQQVSHQR